MFKFAKKRQVLWPVTAQVPADDGSGAVRDVTFRVRYLLMTREELATVARQSLDLMRAGDIDSQIEAMSEERVRESVALMQRHVVGWDGISGEDDQPLPFTADNLNALLAVPYLHRAIASGLSDASVGAPAKNSRPGSDTTPPQTASAQATASPAA